MSTVAIMQPYFVPYAGYFRLIAQADVFVLYDCVQFPRRGYVHRNQLPDAQNKPRWLTLRLTKTPRDTAIKDLTFAADAQSDMQTALRRFPSLHRLASGGGGELRRLLLDFSRRPVTYISDLLSECSSQMGLSFRPVRSSSLDIPGHLHGQERILEIVKRLNCGGYLNAPGGQQLYDRSKFQAAGVDLMFLPPYRGPSWSILHRLLTEDGPELGRALKTN